MVSQRAAVWHLYPHASIGWDNTQRNPSATAESVATNATPDAFEACLWKARAWLDARQNQAPLVTINCGRVAEWVLVRGHARPGVCWGCSRGRADCVLVGAWWPERREHDAGRRGNCARASPRNRHVV